MKIKKKNSKIETIIDPINQMDPKESVEPVNKEDPKENVKLKSKNLILSKERVFTAIINCIKSNNLSRRMKINFSERNDKLYFYQGTPLNNFGFIQATHEAGNIRFRVVLHNSYLRSIFKKDDKVSAYLGSLLDA